MNNIGTKYVIKISLIIILSNILLYSQNNTSNNTISDFYKISINLTTEEKDWLDKHKTISVSGPRSFPPFHSYDEEGLAQGIASDYINILFENLGIKIEIQANLPWPEVLDRAKNKELDVIACSAKSADREEYLLFAEPHLSFPMIIISRNDSPFIGELKDLNSREVAIVDARRKNI